MQAARTLLGGKLDSSACTISSSRTLRRCCTFRSDTAPDWDAMARGTNVGADEKAEQALFSVSDSRTCPSFATNTRLGPEARFSLLTAETAKFETLVFGLAKGWGSVRCPRSLAISSTPQVDGASDAVDAGRATSSDASPPS